MGEVKQRRWFCRKLAELSVMEEEILKGEGNAKEAPQVQYNVSILLTAVSLTMIEQLQYFREGG